MVQPRESNPRPPALQSCALPTELIPPVQSETQNNVKIQNMYTEILLHSTDECQPLGALKSSSTLQFYLTPLGPIDMKKSCPEKEDHPPAETTEKIVDSFVGANSACAYFDCLTLTELTQLGEPKCLYGDTLDQQGG